MKASPAIRATVAGTSWRPFGRRIIHMVCQNGIALSVKCRVRHPLAFGAQITLIDDWSPKPYLAQWRWTHRLYIDFSKAGIVPQGSYGVWVSGSSLSYKQRMDFDNFEQLSTMVDDYFTYVENDVELNLLIIQVGGTFEISTDHVAKV